MIHSFYSKTVLSAFTAKGALAFSKLLYLPLLVQTLSRQDFACFLILSSFEVWFLLMDFGLGSSLQYSLIDHYQQKKNTHSLLRTGLFIGIISFVINFIFLVSLANTFSLTFLAKHLPLYRATSLFFYSGIFFLLQTLGSIATKVLLARQKGYIAHLMQALSAGVSLLLLVTCKKTLFLALLYTIGVQGIFSFFLALFVFWQIPLRGSLDKALMQKSFRFFLFSLLATAVTSSDSFFIPLFAKTEEIPTYNLLCKLFGIIAFIYSAFLQSLSSFPFLQIASYKHRFCRLSVLGVIFSSFGILYFYEKIESFFHIPLNKGLIFLFCLYHCIRVVSDFHALLLQSAQSLKIFFLLIPLQIFLLYFFQYYFSGLGFGIPGFLFAQSLTYFLTVFWILPIWTRRLLLQRVLS